MFFGGSRTFGRLSSGPVSCCHAELVENFEHVVERNWGVGVAVRVIPEKWMNQYTNQNFRKLNFEGSLTSDPASDIAGNRRAVVSLRD